MLASPAIAPTLNVIETVTDPKSQFGPPAASVQVQNASPFVLQVTIDGSQNVIQSFTAQTFDTDGSGTSLVFVPIGGPSGTQGSVTCVWLALNEDPPMTDGQLTGAAQYAVGLGTQLAANTAATLTSPLTLTVPPTTRTILIEINEVTTQLTVAGVQSGFKYYNDLFPYLVTPNGWLVVVPFIGVADQQVTITPSANITIIGVWADTLQYSESVFYTGVPTAVSNQEAATGNYSIISGPCRLLTLDLEVEPLTTLTANITLAGSRILRVQAPGTTPVGRSLTVTDRGLIIPINTTLTLNYASGTGTVTASTTIAYP